MSTYKVGTPLKEMNRQDEIFRLKEKLRNAPAMARTAEVVLDSRGNYVHPNDLQITEKIYTLENQAKTGGGLNPLVIGVGIAAALLLKG